MSFVVEDVSFVVEAVGVVEEEVDLVEEEVDLVEEEGGLMEEEMAFAWRLRCAFSRRMTEANIAMMAIPASRYDTYFFKESDFTRCTLM